MDKPTKAYRKSELKEIDMHSTYKASVKIIAGDGKATKWLALTNPELLKLKRLLTGGKSNDN